MLKRSCPRFMTCAVTANGKPSPSALLILPVTRNPSSGSSPRATVPGIRGRADMPSAKKSLGSSGSYLGWFDIFWRQETRRQKPETRRKKPSMRSLDAPLLVSAFWFLVSLPRDIDNLPRVQCLEELPDAVEVELRIARLDDEEELVARGLMEPPHVEDGVIRHRQAVQREHAEDGREGCEEDRAFERDRDPSRPRVVRLATDVERIADHVRVPAHEEAGQSADDAADQDDGGHAGRVHPHRFVQSVNRVRREGVHLRVAGRARGFGGAHQVRRRGELGDDAVQPRSDFADRHRATPRFLPDAHVLLATSYASRRWRSSAGIGRKGTAGR